MKFYLGSILVLFTLQGFAACDGSPQDFIINDPIDHIPFTVTAKVYRPDSLLKVSTVFIIPPIVGETPIDRGMAQKICSSGMAAYILNVVKDVTIDYEINHYSIHDETYVRALSSVQSVISELEKDSGMNGKFGILGMSLGGMISTYVAGSEPKILASVIVVGAGNVPGVISYSDQKRVAAIREGRMEKFNIPDQASYEQIFKNLVPHDPISVAANIRPGSMYLFIAVNDTTVPTRYQQELRSKVADPLVFEMKGNHVQGIIKAGTIHSRNITNFFSNQLM